MSKPNKLTLLDIKVSQNHYSIKIHINGILHLELKHPEDIIAIHSWKDTNSHYSIEYIYKTGTKVLTEYDASYKFKTILEQLNALS